MKPNHKYLKLYNLYNATNIDTLRGRDNIFNLQEPNDWVCDVIEYQRGHRSMTIKIFEKGKQDNYFMLSAKNIFSFSGTFMWNGANFRLLSSNESLTFLKRFLNFENYPDEILKDLFLIITAINPQTEIIISASDFDIILNEYNPNFIKQL